MDIFLQISLATAGYFRWIDFSRADLWASATVAIEILTNINPFYERLHSKKYHEDDLPILPTAVPYSIRKLLPLALKREIKEVSRKRKLKLLSIF